MAYTMSQREIDLRRMAQEKAARLNSLPRADMGKTVDQPKPAAAAKPPAKKKKAAKKSSRKRG